MHPISEKEDKVIFFTSNLTVEEEYKIVRRPLKNYNKPIQKVLGNEIMPKDIELTKTYKLKETRNFNMEYQNIADVLLALLKCEPFFNLLKVAKDKIKYCREMELFNILCDLIVFIEEKEMSDDIEIDQKLQKLNIEERIYFDITNYVTQIFKIIGISDVLSIYTSIINKLHTEFLIVNFYKEKNWFLPADKQLKQEKGFYEEISPITNIFVLQYREIRKNNNNSSIKHLDHIGITEENINKGIIGEIKSSKQNSLKKYPLILTILTDKNYDKQKFIKIENEEYVFKSAVEDKFDAENKGVTSLLFYQKLNCAENAD